MESVIGEGDIVEYYFAPSPEVAESFLQKRKEGSLDLSSLGFAEEQLDISFQQRSTQSALGSTAVVADSFFTFSANDIPIHTEGMRQMFRHLHDSGPFSTPEKFMYRLGAFDIIHMPDAAENPIPIVTFRLPRTERIPTKGRRRDQYEIERREDLAREKHTAHIRLFCGETLLADTIHQLQPGCITYGPISSNDEFDRSQFWLFDEGGSLVYQEDFYWLNSIGTTGSISGQQVSLNDTLVRRTKGVADKNQTARLQRVNVQSKGITSEVHFSTIHEFRNHQRTMLERGKALLKKPSKDRWFPKGPMGAVDAVLHIKALLEGRNVNEAWIVDPFFDVNALEAIATRIGRRDIKLTIVTSLNTIAPDSGEEVNTQDTAPVEILRRVLPKVRNAVHCRLKVLNLLRSKNAKRQAFHDRYLCTKNNDDQHAVYLLSNSLNSFMGDYPFCISRMSGEAETAVYEYILNLAAKKDAASGNDLYCNLEWDSHER